MTTPVLKTRLGALLLVFAGLLAGCANIPDRTPPKIVLDKPVAEPGPLGKPTPDLDPLSLVQEFISRAGTPELARTYLTDGAKPHWPATKEPTIVQDGFKTPPLPAQEARENPGADPNTTVVLFTATQIGRLKPDRAFYPGVQPIEYRIVVQRQSDGQWRISTPPDVLLIEQSKFDASYRRVNLQYFEPEQRAMVSDPRYVEIEPRADLEGKVMRLLLAGPSDSIKGAVRSQLDGITLRTNVVRENDVVLINLTQVDKSVEERQRIAAQIVKSLSEVTTSPLRILIEGRELIPDHGDWRPADVGSYDTLSTPKPDLLGLVVAGGKVLSMRDGKPIEGPAGAGAYGTVSAAQSLDGSQLAVVQRGAAGMSLRIGKISTDLPEVIMPPAVTLTRPTWLISDANGSSGEVWTVADGTVVIRAVRTSNGVWEDLPVDASELTADGGVITHLRLSRDGVRVAAVVNGEVKVASVVRTNDTVAIRLPRTLQGGKVKDVIGVDWLNKVTLLVATGQTSMPVASLPIDGLTVNPYNSTTLTLPVTAITAAPSRPAVVADGAGMWSTQEAGKVWQAHQHGQGPGALPFYPG